MVLPSSSLSPLEPLLEELCLAARPSTSATVVVAAVAVFLGTRANFKMTEYGVLSSTFLVAYEEPKHELKQCKCRASSAASCARKAKSVCHLPTAKGGGRHVDEFVTAKSLLQKK